MKFPQVLSCQTSETGFVYELCVPVDLAYFAGHFPGTPILPGVVQVNWAAHFAAQQLSLSGRFHKLEQLKFQAVIVPGDCLTLRLQFDQQKNALTFTYDSARGRHSSGRLVYRS